MIIQDFGQETEHEQFIKTAFFPLITVIVFYALVLLCELSGITGDEMGYSLFCFYILGPAVELLCGFSAGKKRGVSMILPTNRDF